MKRRLWRFSLPVYAVGLLIGLGLVATYGAMEVSSTPAFCGSCHIMEPYYDSWVGSSHEEIACVDCHIPPGITAELRKKYEALSMIARYFTGTYGTKPWAEVEDSSCLECHERRLLSGREVFGDVHFDHRPHLTELRRGKRLQCTSCHSQIVQGSHITVTATSCVLCHFKGQESGSGTAECTLCHQVPDGMVEAVGMELDHGQVARLGMACEACHAPPARGEGGVPRERCLTCHNQPALLEEEDGDALHAIHVTDHKVECTYCHLEIEHVGPRHSEASQGECSACHGGRHEAQRNLYAGLGGSRVEPMPDVMYRAGVRCEGCHLEAAGEGSATAGEVSCMSCHGPSYRSLYQGWRETLDTRSAALRRQLEGTEQRLGSRPAEALESARANLALVEDGIGIHNVQFSLALLSAAQRQLNEARRESGLPEIAPPWPQAPYASPCLDCHAGAEALSSRAFGRSFPHAPHVTEAALDCESCHSTHEEREASGAPAMKLAASACADCHHADAAAGSCSGCHREIGGRTFATELGDFSHVSHVDEMELACSDCHGATPRRQPDFAVCADCH